MGNASIFTGANKMLGAFKGLRDRAGEFGAALRQEAEIEATEAKRICPVWNSDRPVPADVVPGELRATIQADGPFREGKRVWATVTAGGPAVDYALKVHEDTEAFHKVGEAKFISRTLEKSAPNMKERIAKRIDENFGRR